MQRCCLRRGIPIPHSCAPTTHTGEGAPCGRDRPLLPSIPGGTQDRRLPHREQGSFPTLLAFTPCTPPGEALTKQTLNILKEQMNTGQPNHPYQRTHHSSILPLSALLWFCIIICLPISLSFCSLLRLCLLPSYFFSRSCPVPLCHLFLLLVLFPLKLSDCPNCPCISASSFLHLGSLSTHQVTALPAFSLPLLC